MLRPSLAVWGVRGSSPLGSTRDDLGLSQVFCVSGRFDLPDGSAEGNSRDDHPNLSSVPE
jgi:hypothetical protein